MTEHRFLRDDLRIHWLDGGAALVLDRRTGRIVQVSGRAARSLRSADGEALRDPEVAAALSDLGLIEGTIPDRRAVLSTASVASLGLAVLSLPVAAAAASVDLAGAEPEDLDASTAAVVSLGRAGFAVTSVGDDAYVAAGAGGSPYAVRLHVPSMTIVGQVQIAVTNAWPFAITTDGTDLFIGTDDDRTIHRVALTGGGEGTGGLSVLGAISISAASGNAAAYDLARSGSFLYALTGGAPARVIKIALTGGGAGTGGMVVQNTLTLDSGENTGWRMEVMAGLAYATLLTNPGRVVAVDLTDGSSDVPVRLGGITLETGEDRPRVITSSGSDIFVATETSPSTLVRLATTGGGEGTGGLLRRGALTLTSTNKVNALTSAGGYVFAGAYESTRTVNRVALTGGDVGAGGMRVDSAMTLPGTTGYSGLHDAVVVGDRLVFVSRGQSAACSVDTGI